MEQHWNSIGPMSRFCWAHDPWFVNKWCWYQASSILSGLYRYDDFPRQKLNNLFLMLHDLVYKSNTDFYIKLIKLLSNQRINAAQPVQKQLAWHDCVSLCYKSVTINIYKIIKYFRNALQRLITIWLKMVICKLQNQRRNGFFLL